MMCQIKSFFNLLFNTESEFLSTIWSIYHTSLQCDLIFSKANNDRLIANELDTACFDHLELRVPVLLFDDTWVFL